MWVTLPSFRPPAYWHECANMLQDQWGGGSERRQSAVCHFACSVYLSCVGQLVRLINELPVFCFDQWP